MGKYYSVDPETCSIEELKAAIEECENKAEFFEACQLGVKLFLNSVYGAMASAYYVCNNLSIAESITLQGQDLIKYSMKVIINSVTGFLPSPFALTERGAETSLILYSL